MFWSNQCFPQMVSTMVSSYVSFINIVKQKVLINGLIILYYSSWKWHSLVAYEKSHMMRCAMTPNKPISFKQYIYTSALIVLSHNDQEGGTLTVESHVPRTVNSHFPVTLGPIPTISQKSDRNWRKIKDSDIRVLLKRYIYIFALHSPRK